MITINHASSKRYTRHQVSLHAGETVTEKALWEQDMAQFLLKFKHYHTVNGKFCSKEFHYDLAMNDLKINFCRTRAHQQTGISEHAITTMVKWAQTLMFHVVLH